jgi:hypothetical protein
MSIPYNLNIPASGNNPSNDQPDMQTNTNSINTLVAIDHYTFSDNPAGTHKQITFPNNNVITSGSLAGLSSAVFSNAGTADNSTSQLFYVNSKITVPVSIVRAYAAINPLAISLTQSYNVASFVRNSAGNYTVTLTANSTTSSSYGILCSCDRRNGSTNAQIIDYHITGTTTFTLFSADPIINSAEDPTNLTFIVLQL